MIRFDERWVQPILSGEKTTTIRLKVTARAGETRALCRIDDSLFAWAKIIDVKQQKLSLIDMKKEGFAHWKDAGRYLQLKFSDVVMTANTMFYVIEFERTMISPLEVLDEKT